MGKVNPESIEVEKIQSHAMEVEIGPFHDTEYIRIIIGRFSLKRYLRSIKP